MEKDTRFFLIGSGVGLGGVGLQMTGAPHWVGWAIAIVGLCVAIFPFVAHRLNPEPVFHPTNDLRDAPPEPAQAASPKVIQRDVWVHDAIWRIYSGRWERRSLGPHGTGFAHEDIERLHECLKEIRQAAADGLLQVWGKLGPVGTLWEPIPKGAWSEGNIDWFSFEGHGPELLWMAGSIESALNGPHGRDNWRELKTSRARIDELWPAHSVVGSRGGDVHIGPGTYRAGDGGLRGKGSDISFGAGDAAPLRRSLISRFDEMREAGREEARTELANLRGTGVGLRNEGVNAIFSEARWADWNDKLIKWNDEVVKIIGKISKADAQWFAILDTVPPPRIPMDSIFAGDEDKHIYAMHDFRLKKLEKLIEGYRPK
jgi:hypothetical protein